MRIYEYEKYVGDEGKCVLAIGFFDGVHVAHRALISRAVNIGRQLSLPIGVFTFSPKSNIKKSSTRIYTLDQRLSIIESLGVDFAVISNFDDIRNISAEEFCHTVLPKILCCNICVVGYNFRFGKGAVANAQTLSEMALKHGYTAMICKEERLGGETVSSSAIRRYLSEGNMSFANEMLGEPYFLLQTVVHGKGIGSKRLGVPTANLSYPDDVLIPRFGVYAAFAEFDGKKHPAAVNLGVCPTYKKDDVHVEANILGYSGDVYGKKIKLTFISFLRDEMRFKSEEELKMQIELDKNAIIKELNLKND